LLGLDRAQAAFADVVGGPGPVSQHETAGSGFCR
jgi:hypothetical protein